MGLPGIIPETGIAGDGFFRFPIGKQTGTEHIVPVIGRFFPEILHNPVLLSRRVGEVDEPVEKGQQLRYR